MIKLTELIVFKNKQKNNFVKIFFLSLQMILYTNYS